MLCLSAVEVAAQEGGPDLSGTWEFDTEETVRITQDGAAVRAEFLDGAACLDGQVRPYFLDGVLSGTSLTGSMMVCSRSPRLVEECGISSMYETTFEATVESGRIAGTRVAQGLATEEEGGRYVSCVPDSRYDGTYDFAGTRSCGDLEREVEDLQDDLDARTEALNELADVIAATPGIGNWLEEGYDGPAADLAAEYRRKDRELVDVHLLALHEAHARLAECSGGCPSPAYADGLRDMLDRVVDEANAIADEFAAMELVGWFEEGYAGPHADRAARWREIEQEMLELLERINASQDPAEKAALQARVDELAAEANVIEDHLNPLNVTNWLEDDYVGPHADRAALGRAKNLEMEGVLARLQEAEAALREC